MLVVDLQCEHGHVFEGWFASAEDLASQQARKLLSCPVCGHAEIVRRPAASRLNVSSLKSPLAEPGARPAKGDSQVAAAPQIAGTVPGPVGADVSAEQALQALYWQAVRHVVANTEDVGDRFAEAVRDMHRGDAPQRPVRGQADQEVVAELRDEGIEVLSLPIPDALKGPLQ
jgi:hypothetical protein